MPWLICKVSLFQMVLLNLGFLFFILLSFTILFRRLFVGRRLLNSHTFEIFVLFCFGAELCFLLNEFV